MAERKRDREIRHTKLWSALGVVAVLLLSALTGLVALGAAPSSASGASSVVPIAPFNGGTCTVTVSHETMGDHAVQLAINTYGPISSAIVPVTICIGPGSFPEQLTINDTVDLSLVGAGSSSTLLDPSGIGSNGVDLDSQLPAYAIIGAWNDTGLTISDLGVDGTSALASVNCGVQFSGVYFGNTTGALEASSVTGISDGGCQAVNAVLADTGWFQTNVLNAQTVQVVGNSVTGYGKNGITCNGNGLTCDVSGNTVSTTPMPYGLSATNGIQFWGATGTIQSNQVSGNVYLPGSCLDQNYFSSGVSCVSPYWASGVLVIAPPTTVQISSNVLTNNQVGIWSIGGPTLASGNTVTNWGYYGIVLDFSVADAFGTIYTTGPYVGEAQSNDISDQNVGVLAYDDNATIVGNSFTGVNVSVEVATDTGVPSTDTVSSNVADVNVSGALLGDVSSFQSGDSATPTASYTVDANTFTNVSGPGTTTPGTGIAVYGASADVEDNQVVGFPNGISAVVTATGAVTANDNTVSAPSPAIAGAGIYVFAGSATVQGNTVSGFSWMTGPGWWPDSQATGLFVQCLATCGVSENVLDSNAIGIAVLSYLYGPFPAPGWPYAAPPSAGPVSVSDNTVTDSGAFGIALELNQQSSSETAAPTVSVTGNTVDNTLSGAVGLMVDQGTYTITGDTFVGTTLTGSSGASQPTGEGAIATASIQVLDAYDSATLAFVGSNTYLDTSLTVAVLNLTTSPEYFAGVVGLPVLAAPGTPTVSATALDVDQTLTVSGSIPPASGVPLYSWSWLVSMNGGAYSAATQCATDSGSGVWGGTAVACVVAGGSLSPGTMYTFELEVTDSATPAVTATSAASSVVSVATALSNPGVPTVSATALDDDQTLTVTGGIPTTGTPPYSWTWLVSENGGTFSTASVCTTNTGSALGGATVTCTVLGGTLAAGASYAFKLEVTDSATAAQTTVSAASSTVAVASTLTAPGAPTVSATALDVNQALTVKGTIPATGTPTYAWQWLVSVNGGPFVPATQCSTDSGSGVAGGTQVTCSIAASRLTVGATYSFALEVTDSATAAQTQTSSASPTVTVASALASPHRPTVNRPALDVNQVLTVSGKIPTTGSAPYSWTWLVSVNGGAFVPATQCSVPSGTGGSAGAATTCTIPAGTLTVGSYYNFELRVTDGATSPQTKTSSSTLQTVTVRAALTAPGKPSVSATALDVDQTLTATGGIPTTGTSPYAWAWLISVNGGAYAAATQCTVAGGTGALAGAVETCTIPGNTLTVGDHYAFELRVTDGATTMEEKTSSASATVTVSSQLTAPGTPTVSYTRIDVAQTLKVKATVPTTGTPRYAWVWLVSVNGGGFSTASVCTANSGTASGGASITCTVPGGTLTPGDTYAFEFQVSDSATAPETQVSAASPTVTVAT